MIELDKNIWLKPFNSENEYVSHYNLMKVENHFPIYYHGDTNNIPDNLISDDKLTDCSHCIIYRSY